ncbi:hypothetical protein Goari_007962 [Gossypium aridum]|uniref:Pentatricopeptide repeat-containing protein n=1 Tax=Gossypium aridum TaxID=34290 RepID=A0A7J8XTV9_GOSAI|nr:hypothetical protein [Gossypium aridum]
MNHLKQIQAQTFLLGLHQDSHTLNKLIAFCTDPTLGTFRYAEKIFNLVQYPSLFIYNVMIKTFVKKGSHKNAILVFGKLREQGLWPDNFTYPFVFKAIGSLGALFEGQKIHGLVAKSGLEFDAYVVNSLMDMYVQVGRIQCSKKLFDEMPQRDVVAWNVLISGLVKCGKFEDAVNLFGLMRKEGLVKPNEATIVSTLSACTALGRLDLGKEIDHYAREELELTTIIGNALLDMYCKCGCLDIARKLFDDMPSKNVNCWTSMVSGYVNVGQLAEARRLFERSPVRDVVLWTAMINGYVQFNCFDEAVGLFQEMQAQRVKPDKFVLVSLLTVNGETSKALELFSEMEQTNKKPDDITFIGVLSACSHGGLVEEGRKVFDSISKVYHMEPKLEHYACLIDLLCRAGLLVEVEKLIDDIPGKDTETIVPLYGSLLSACRTYGNVEMGERMAQRLVEIQSSDSSVHTLLSNIYASADRWEDVKKVREKMKDLGVKKVPGCSSIKVDGAITQS